MTKQKWESIRDQVADEMTLAQEIMHGQREGYDGADGARTVIELCKNMHLMLVELEKHIQ